MSKRDSICYIRKKVEERELWEQLAEECCELSHAALKMIRARGLSGNVTPIKAEEAEEKMRMEAIHVCIIMQTLGIGIPQRTIENAPEWERWERRLREAEEHGQFCKETRA